jgi:hypothetical protein
MKRFFQELFSNEEKDTHRNPITQRQSQPIYSYQVRPQDIQTHTNIQRMIVKGPANAGVQNNIAG